MRRFHSIAAVSFSFLAACSNGNPSFRSTVQDGGGLSEGSAPAAPYTQTLLQDAHIGSDSSRPDFQQASADVQLAGAPFASVTLVADLTSPCFPWSNWQTDPPPSGQSWPADCDAFDRNFELSLADPASPASPALELVRAITPFGGPEHIEQDVTDVFNAVRSDRMFRVAITAYPDPAGRVSGSNGGWTVSAHLDVVPGRAPRNVLAVIPLYYDSVTAAKVISDVAFSVPAGTTSSRLEYRVTGHGGATATGGASLPSCFGPADEFCRRLHHVVLDGQEIAQLTPWRNDCDQLCVLTDGGPFGAGQYCSKNPCGSPSSVQASRANWCPGSVTLPQNFAPAALSAPGSHAFRFAIDGIAQGGQWRVSAVAYAYGD
jgi:Peptide-N-glycosidase F, C terminal